MTKSKKFVSLFLVFALLLISPALHAKLHFRGKPLPECKWFFITEAGGFFRIIGGFGQLEANCEFGLMRNQDKNYALGATVFGTLVEDNSGVGFKLRYRRWLSSSWSVDISPGLLLWSEGKTPAFTGQVGLNYRDWVALITQVDVRETWYGSTQVNLSFGIKFGSYAGASIAVAAAVVAGAALIALASAGPWWAN